MFVRLRCIPYNDSGVQRARRQMNAVGRPGEAVDTGSVKAPLQLMRQLQHTPTLIL